MPFDPEKDPKTFLVILVATGMKIFGNKSWWSNDEYLSDAQQFVDKIETKFGKLK